jgi:hypothetical protein
LAIAAANYGDVNIGPAAMVALEARWTTYEKTKDKEIVDDDYRKVVRAYLASDDGVTLARSIAAAKTLLLGESPDQETIDLLLAIYERNDAAKSAVIDSLWTVKDWSKKPAISAMFEGALSSPEDHLVSSALFRWSGGIFSSTDRERVMGVVEGLLSHKNPGIRGRSIEMLTRGARSTEEKDKYGALIETLLADENPYVRAKAAGAMGSFKRTTALATMVGMLDDTEKCTYQIEGWNKLDGTSGRVHHDGSPWSTVQDAVLRGIQTMSYSMKPRFKMSDVSYKTVEADLKTNVKEARAWYGKVKGSL